MNRRQELLHEQMQIFENHCNICPYNEPEFRNSHCLGCEYYARLRKIGNDLLFDTSSTRLNNGKGWKFSKEWYLGLKSQGLNDKQVAKRARISTATLVKFKRKHGLTK